MDWSSLLSSLGYIPNMLFSKNPADEALKTVRGATDQMKPYYEPYMQAGKEALPQLQGQYGQLMNDPAGFMNKLGSGFQQSPGFDFSLKQALQSAGNAAAAGGMAGSPQHEFQNMGLATNLANQDYNNWMKQAMGAYGTGLEGQQGLYNTSYDASKEMGNSIANQKMTEAMLQYLGQNQKNQGINGLLGSITGALTGFL